MNHSPVTVDSPRQQSRVLIFGRHDHSESLKASEVPGKVDAAVKARIDNIAGYTVTEHYAVYRNNDEVHPAAEMTVKTTYEHDSGKSYIIVSQSGSTIIRNLVLNAILDNEERLNRPGTRESAWITSTNYEMKLEPGETQPLDGRDCMVLALIPKRKAPFLFEGTLWVDSKDGRIQVHKSLLNVVLLDQLPEHNAEKPLIPFPKAMSKAVIPALRTGNIRSKSSRRPRSG